MTTSQEISALYNPEGDERVPRGTFRYFETRNRFRVFGLILQDFERSGIAKATLARRMGKDASQINHLLGSPGNLTLDTISNLLFAISGSEPTYGLADPLEKPARNDVRPDWLNRETSMIIDKALEQKSAVTTDIDIAA